VAFVATIKAFGTLQMLTIFSSPAATAAASSTSSASSVFMAITTETAIEIVMIPITTFYFSVISLVWMFASHLGNDLLLLILLPLLAVNI
jgi:hypothetical protein